MSHRIADTANTPSELGSFSGQFESTSQLKKRYNLANSTLHWLRKTQGFPAPFKLGPRLVRYESKKVDEWMASRRPVAIVGASK